MTRDDATSSPKSATTGDRAVAAARHGHAREQRKAASISESNDRRYKSRQIYLGSYNHVYVARVELRAWPRYSGGVFAVLETSARQARRGVWQGEFQKPWNWRAARREQTASSQTIQSPSFAVGQSACTIKGNISGKGERIYHLPGQKYYDRTKISQSKGEHCFCSEDEARAAGWRAARS